MNIAIIRNADIYSPERQGKGNILIINDKIAALGPDVELPSWACDPIEVDAKGQMATPGLIDGHVHITGGRRRSRFPHAGTAFPFSVPVTGGVTTIGGLLGTDGITRHVDNVLAKAYSLEEEGLSTFIMTGGYPLPSPTLTGSVQRDFAYVPKVRGAKVAIADIASPRSARNSWRPLPRMPAWAVCCAALWGCSLSTSARRRRASRASLKCWISVPIWDGT
ncbi:MAG: hypothetical protein V8Q84_01075 [Bilophila sp.]